MNEIKNSDNSALKKAFKTTVIVLTVMLLIMTAFFAVILTVLSGGFGSVNSEIAGMLRFIRTFVLIGGLIITVIADIALYRSYKSKTRLMFEVKPLDCAVEDFLISSYYQKHRRHYKITPVLRDISTGELYCTFGVYDMSFYASSWSQNGNSPLNISILRSDGSAVELGDPIRIYVKRTVDVKVETDDSRYAFNGRWHEFNNVNNAYGMQIVHALRFFEGIVDVERY